MPGFAVDKTTHSDSQGESNLPSRHTRLLHIPPTCQPCGACLLQTAEAFCWLWQRTCAWFMVRNTTRRFNL